MLLWCLYWFHCCWWTNTVLVSLCCVCSRCSLPEAPPGWKTSSNSSMSRVSSTPKRYAGSSYTSHYSSYSPSLTPGLSTYSERDRLSTYRSPNSTSSSGYSSSYLSSSAARGRNYSASSDPDRDRGRTIPRTDILGSSSSSSSINSRRSESLSRTPVKSYGSSGLSGGSAYSGYSSYQSNYLASPLSASSISLNRRKSVSQSDLSRDLSSLSLRDASSSSTPSSSTSALRSYHSRTKDVPESYDIGSRSGSSSLLRSSTQEAFSSSSISRAYSSSTWEPSSNGMSDTPRRNSTVSPLFFFFFCFYMMCAHPDMINKKTDGGWVESKLRYLPLMSSALLCFCFIESPCCKGKLSVLTLQLIKVFLDQVGALLVKLLWVSCEYQTYWFIWLSMEIFWTSK